MSVEYDTPEEKEKRIAISAGLPDMDRAALLDSLKREFRVRGAPQRSETQTIIKPRASNEPKDA